jgi:WD40 repeat protein
MWKLPQGEQTAAAAPPFPYSSVSISPQGRYLFYWSGNAGKARIALYDIGEQKLTDHFLPSMGEPPFQIDWSADDAWIAALEDGKLVAREVPTGKLAFTCAQSTAATRTPAFSPDGRLLAAAVDGKIHLWSTKDGALQGTVDDVFSELGLHWSPDGKYLAVPQRPSFVFVDIAKRAAVQTVPLADAIDIYAGASSIVWSSDSRQLNYTVNDQLVTLDVKSDKPVDVATMPILGGLLGHGETVTDGARFWSAKTERFGGTLLQLARGGAVVIGPTGHYRASPLAERELVYVVETPKEVKTFTPDEFQRHFRWKNDPKQARLLPRGK